MLNFTKIMWVNDYRKMNARAMALGREGSAGSAYSVGSESPAGTSTAENNGGSPTNGRRMPAVNMHKQGR